MHFINYQLSPLWITECYLNGHIFLTNQQNVLNIGIWALKQMQKAKITSFSFFFIFLADFEKYLFLTYLTISRKAKFGKSWFFREPSIDLYQKLLAIKIIFFWSYFSLVYQSHLRKMLHILIAIQDTNQYEDKNAQSFVLKAQKKCFVSLITVCI